VVEMTAGTMLIMNPKNRDLAVLGSPTTMMLTSPRRWVPLLGMCSLTPISSRRSAF
jgi:hypothetical protein